MKRKDFLAVAAARQHITHVESIYQIDLERVAADALGSYVTAFQNCSESQNRIFPRAITGIRPRETRSWFSRMRTVSPASRVVPSATEH